MNNSFWQSELKSNLKQAKHSRKCSFIIFISYIIFSLFLFSDVSFSVVNYKDVSANIVGELYELKFLSEVKVNYNIKDAKFDPDFIASEIFSSKTKILNEKEKNEFVLWIIDKKPIMNIVFYNVSSTSDYEEKLRLSKEKKAILSFVVGMNNDKVAVAELFYQCDTSKNEKCDQIFKEIFREYYNPNDKPVENMIAVLLAGSFKIENQGIEMFEIGEPQTIQEPQEPQEESQPLEDDEELPEDDEDLPINESDEENISEEPDQEEPVSEEEIPDEIQFNLEIKANEIILDETARTFNCEDLITFEAVIDSDRTDLDPNSFYYLWHFGNDESSTGQNTTTFYDIAGEYIVRLQVFRTNQYLLEDQIAEKSVSVIVEGENCPSIESVNDFELDIKDIECYDKLPLAGTQVCNVMVSNRKDEDNLEGLANISINITRSDTGEFCGSNITSEDGETTISFVLEDCGFNNVGLYTIDLMASKNFSFKNNTSFDYSIVSGSFQFEIVDYDSVFFVPSEETYEILYDENLFPYNDFIENLKEILSEESQDNWLVVPSDTIRNDEIFSKAINQIYSDNNIPGVFVNEIRRIDIFPNKNRQKNQMYVIINNQNQEVQKAFILYIYKDDLIYREGSEYKLNESVIRDFIRNPETMKITKYYDVYDYARQFYQSWGIDNFMDIYQINFPPSLKVENITNLEGYSLISYFEPSMVHGQLPLNSVQEMWNSYSLSKTKKTLNNLYELNERINEVPIEIFYDGQKYILTRSQICDLNDSVISYNNEEGLTSDNIIIPCEFNFDVVDSLVEDLNTNNKETVARLYFLYGLVQEEIYRRSNNEYNVEEYLNKFIDSGCSFSDSVYQMRDRIKENLSNYESIRVDSVTNLKDILKKYYEDSSYIKKEDASLIELNYEISRVLFYDSLMEKGIIDESLVSKDDFSLVDYIKFSDQNSEESIIEPVRENEVQEIKENIKKYGDGRFCDYDNIYEVIFDHSLNNDIDPRFVLALLIDESLGNYTSNKNKVGTSSGSVGLMQLSSFAAQDLYLCNNPSNTVGTCSEYDFRLIPYHNIYGGINYIKMISNAINSDRTLARSLAYNAGMGLVNNCVSFLEGYLDPNAYMTCMTKNAQYTYVTKAGKNYNSESLFKSDLLFETNEYKNVITGNIETINEREEIFNNIANTSNKDYEIFTYAYKINAQYLELLQHISIKNKQEFLYTIEQYNNLLNS